MLNELIKRKVPGALTGYAVACFVVLQIADVTFEALGLTAGHVRLLLVGMIAALPVVAYLSWKFDLRGGRVEGKRSKRPILELGISVAISVSVFVGVLYIWPPRLSTDDSAIEVITELPSLDAIAVLPFRNLSSDESQGFLATGISRDLSDLLALIPSLRVVPPVTTEAYAARSDAASDLGRDLDARYIVTGGLERRGERFRLRAALNDSEADQLIWSASHEEPTRAFYEVLDDIVGAIATSLSAEIDANRAVALAARSAFDLSAYEHIQLAEDARRFYSREAAEKVVEELQKALEIQPDNAVAHAYLSEQFGQNLVSRYTSDPANTAAAMSKHLQIAQSLAPNDPRVLRAAGVVAVMSGKLEEASRLLKRSLARNPNDPHTRALFGYSVGMTGQLDAGLALIEWSERTAPAHPRYAVWPTYRGGVYLLKSVQDRVQGSNLAYVRQFTGAQEEAVQRNPQYHFSYFSLAVGYAIADDRPRMVDSLRRGLKIAPDFTPEEYRVGATRIGQGYVFEEYRSAWETLRATWLNEQAEDG